MSCTLKELAEWALVQRSEAGLERREWPGGSQELAAVIGVREAFEDVMFKITGTRIEHRWQSFIDQMEGDENG